MFIHNKYVLSFPDKMTDDQFFRFCESNQNLRIERNEKGDIEIMAGTGGKTGMQEAEIGRQLGNWNSQTKLGVSFSPSTAFVLKSGAIRLGDAAWMSLERWNALTSAEQDKFIPVPDFVIELRSPSDSLSDLQEKMEKWIQSGVKLAWLINPEDETTYIYRENGERLIVKGLDKTLSGEDVLIGFELDLKELK